jgi:hypothetical protein
MDEFTVGDLKRQLAHLDDETLIEFSGGLTFYRFKRIGDDAVVLEFAEAEADLKPKTRELIQVAFMRMPQLSDDEPVKSISVPRL